MGVDVGGTFTDLVVRDSGGGIHVFKVPSVPQSPTEGVITALQRAADAFGLALREFLGGCVLFVHGSTIATNTLLERKGARVGLLTTEGFRDSLEIRRGLLTDPWRHRRPFPPVLVPRYLRRPIGGRIGKDGRELTPLSARDVEAAVNTFRDEGVESVAICLFNSFLNPVHEQVAADLIRKTWEGGWLSVSSDIVPVIGEYERTATTVMNAYLAPRTGSYVRALEARLRELGLRQPPLLIQNNGGAISVGQSGERPVTLLLSGPAAGVGALNFYAQAIGSDNLISMEIGGTSCDTILMSRGEVAFRDRFEIDEYHLALPAVEVHSIGAGGGTIAGVDSGGLLFVGPEGAGARPGPACYGLGGSEPTVTDAQLVLGRLRAGGYAGGAIEAREPLARQAIDERVARPLGITVEAAAVGIIRLMEQKLLHALQRISIERGYDARLFTLVAGGGAGPLHGAPLGRQIGCLRVYVPRLAGAFCALGMLNSDVRHDYVRVYLGRLADADGDVVEDLFTELEARARESLSNEGFEESDSHLVRAMDLRYIGQQWDITVTVPKGRLAKSELRQAFEAEHNRLFGHTQPDGIVEMTMLRCIGFGHLPPLGPPARRTAVREARPTGYRPVWVDEAMAWTEVPIYRGQDLMTGHSIAGPAIVDEETTTVLVGAGDRLEVDQASNFMITLAPRA